MQDALQRDYTVNALYFTIGPSPLLVDPLNGLDHIRTHTLKLANEVAFSEDLGGQLRFWKVFLGTEFMHFANARNLQNQEVPLPTFVALLLETYLTGHRKDTDKLFFFYKKMRSKLFKDSRVFVASIPAFQNNLCTKNTCKWWHLATKIAADAQIRNKLAVHKEMSVEMMILLHILANNHSTCNCACRIAIDVP